MSNELLSCPFCGGKAETDATSVSEFYGHEHQDYTIECTKCGADMTVCTHSNKDGTPSKGYEFGCSCCNDIPAAAKAKWNKRSQSAPAGYVMVPVDLFQRILSKCSLSALGKDYARVWELLEAAPKAEPVQVNSCGNCGFPQSIGPHCQFHTAATKAEQPPVQDITHWSIQVEKRLCEKLGKPWQASGMSIETLIDELAAAPKPPVQQCEAPSCGCADAYCKAWDEAPQPSDDVARDAGEDHA